MKDRNGKETKEKVMVYEYEPELEDKYRHDLFKTFKKNIDSGLFRFIILDCVNDKVRHFEEFANYAALRKFQVRYPWFSFPRPFLFVHPMSKLLAVPFSSFVSILREALLQ